MTTSYDAIIIGSGAGTVRTKVLPQCMKALRAIRQNNESAKADFHELKQGFSPPNYSKESAKGIQS